MSWNVVYYVSPGGENPVSKFIDSCTKRQQVKILRVLKHLEEYGAQTAIHYIKKLSNIIQSNEKQTLYPSRRS